MRRTHAALLTVVAVAMSVAAYGAADKAKYNFETSTQNWKPDATAGSVSVSKTQHFAGSSSLALHISGAKVNRFSVMLPPVKPGGTVTFHVWVPKTGVTIVQPFVQDRAFKWIGKWTPMTQIKGGAWNTFSIAIPKDAKSPIWKIGIEVTGDGKSSPMAYIDALG